MDSSSHQRAPVVCRGAPELSCAEERSPTVDLLRRHLFRKAQDAASRWHLTGEPAVDEHALAVFSGQLLTDDGLVRRGACHNVAGTLSDTDRALLQAFLMALPASLDVVGRSYLGRPLHRCMRFSGSRHHVVEEITGEHRFVIGIKDVLAHRDRAHAGAVVGSAFSLQRRVAVGHGIHVGLQIHRCRHAVA